MRLYIFVLYILKLLLFLIFYNLCCRRSLIEDGAIDGIGGGGSDGSGGGDIGASGGGGFDGSGGGDGSGSDGGGFDESGGGNGSGSGAEDGDWRGEHFSAVRPVETP